MLNKLKSLPLSTPISIGITASLVFSACSGGISSEKENKKPNIIYILADDLGYNEVGCYGQSLIETPNIDALSSTGIKFTQHYSGSPVCAPSRCVLLTGKHTGHAYIRGNDEWGARGEVWSFVKMNEDPNLEGQRPIPEGTLTIGRLLQGVGYKTACIGKWGLGGPLTEGIPNNQGFDLFFGYNCQRQAHTYYPQHLWKNQEKLMLDNELVVPGENLEEGADIYDKASYNKFNLKNYSPALMIEEALSFIENNNSQPFFLYFCSPIPHVPLQAPDEFVNKYISKFGEEEPYTGKSYFPNRNPHATYAAMVSYLDYQIGQLVNKLKELGIYENTLILFSSDNGPSYAGGADPLYFESAKPFKSEYGWGKGFTHEGGIRVPMIASWPGQVKSGTNSDHISAFWDVLPTLCEIAGAEIPADIDGISFTPTLFGKKDQKEHEYLYWEFPAYQGQQAVRMGDWKGIRKNIFKGNMDIELYNLKDDISEQMNLAEEYPEIVEKIREIMIEARIPPDLERFKIKELGDN